MTCRKLSILIVWALGLSNFLFAQSFSIAPEEFGPDFLKRLERYESDEKVKALIKSFQRNWNGGAFSIGEQQKTIAQINSLQNKGLRLHPDVVNYFWTVLTIKEPGIKGTLDIHEFFHVIDSSIKYLPTPKLLQIFPWVQEYCRTTIVYKENESNWSSSGATPNFTFIVDSNAKFNSYPALRYVNAYLTFSHGKDSSSIKGASGILNIFNRHFKGAGGKYDWSRLGVSADESYCTLSNNYFIDLRKKDFVIDSVIFYYKNLLAKPLKGILTEDFRPYRRVEEAVFPYFKSVEGGVHIDNFVENITYEGGFSLRGLTKIGSRTETQPATLLIQRRGELACKLETDEVLLNPKKMTAESAKMRIYLPEGDTLYHASMRLYYDVATKELVLSLNRNLRISRQPIIDSYHKTDMYFDAIQWKPQNDTIYFTATVDKEHKLFAVESEDFFKYDRYKQFRGVLPFNPIGIIYRYYKKEKEKEKKRKQQEKDLLEDEEETKSEPDEWDFGGGGETEKSWDDMGENEKEDAGSEEGEGGEPSSNEGDKALEEEQRQKAEETETRCFIAAEILARYKQSKHLDAFIQSIEDLVGAGVVDYDPKTGEVCIRNQLIAWGKAAEKKKDYDAISIPSMVSQGYNAYMLYSTKELVLRGINNFSLSDSQLVQITPENKTIYMSKNRSFRAGGKIKAGKINLIAYGSPNHFSFAYPDYKINCDTIHYLTFSPERDPRVQEHPEILDKDLALGLSNLKIENLSGAVYIDKPNNKNGRKPHPEYAYFDCYTESYVFWSDTAIQNGVYNRDKLYFVVDPFTIDSLEIFEIKSLFFMGELNMGEIMPALRDTLKPVADKSFGIEETLPEEGVPVYDGKGRYYNKIEMDAFALHGNGKLEYLTSTATSDSFIFHFDSVMAKTKSFVVPRGEFGGFIFPDIKADQVNYKWYTKKDEIVLQTDQEPILLYNGQASLRGQLVYSPSGVTGKGTFIVGNEEYESNNFKFEDGRFIMDDGTFAVKDPEIPTKRYFKATQIYLVRDIETGTAEFETVEDSSGLAHMEYTQHKYKSTLNRGLYNKNTSHVRLESKGDSSAHYFSSFDTTKTNNQHGLSFPGATADYNIIDEIIDIKGADSIFVADATVFPKGAEVIVTANGRLDHLSECIIKCNNKNRYHKIFAAEADVNSGIDYIAAGNYNYKFKNHTQTIRFDSVYVRQDTVTLAHSFIPEEMEFFMTERFYFKDTIILEGDHKFLHFKGFVKIQSSNPALSESWIPINERDVNPDSVVVPVDTSVLSDLAVGIYFMRERSAFYSRFLEKKFEKKDLPVLTASGSITYDLRTQEFKIGEQRKLKRQRYTGNVVAYNDSTNVITSQGVLDFPYNFNPKKFIDMKMIGRWRENNNTRSIKTNLMWSINLPPEFKDAMNILASKLNLVTESADLVKVANNRLLLESLAELVPDEDTTEKKMHALEANIETYGEIHGQTGINDIPSSLVLSGVELYYCDENTPLFYCPLKHKVGIITINGRKILKEVEAKITYHMGRFNPNRTFAPDTVRILLKLNDLDDYFFLEFYDNQITMSSPFGEFNNAVNEVALKHKKKSKGGKDELSVGAVKGDDGDSENPMNRFNSRFMKLYYSKCGM